MNKPTAAMFARNYADFSGVPQTTFQDGWDSWSFAPAAEAAEPGRQLLVTWLPAQYFSKTAN